MVETEGVLGRQLLVDPFLEGVGAVVLDEFHERSLHTDLAIAMLREIRDTVRDDLILVVMSATLDAEPVARFLGDCPVVQVPGRVFPVEVAYRPTGKPAAPETIAAAIEDILANMNDRGHILVFLPGANEIRRAGGALEPIARREGLDVVPLHGSLPSDEQDRALRPSDRRKVVLATNIAETSVTIDGVTTVIDSGLARTASFDAARGLDRLELGRISQASAAQRAGRAGRTAPGRCVRLWSEREQRGLAEFETPEVARVDLASTALALRAWGAPDPSRFGWFEPPPSERIEAAARMLVMLGALGSAEGEITPLGRQLLAVPAHPRIARLLTAAAASGHASTGASLAALLSERDITMTVDRHGEGGGTSRPRLASGRGSSDLLERLDLLAQAEHARFASRLREQGIDPMAARQAARVRDDLLRIARRIPGGRDEAGEEPEEETLLQWILLAYPDRVVRRRGGEARGVMVGGRGIRLDPESVVRQSELFLALDPREDRRGGTLEARVRIASEVRLEWLEAHLVEFLRRERSVEFDTERGRAVEVNTLWYRDLLLREDRNSRVGRDEASLALAKSVAPRAREFFRHDQAAASWLSRLEFLRGAMPESGLPEFDEVVLAKVVEAATAGKVSIDELRQVSFVPLLEGRLTHTQSRFLKEHAPETLTVPSGSRIRLSYTPGLPPVLAVRLQELFGWADTPRIAGGRVPVVLHLLGPNFRPVQVTDDLRSFWATTYFQVRKDLRARYPRHAWPEDPLSARPEAKGGRRS
jgi:ATP-dependent helicase HrpB